MGGEEVMSDLNARVAEQREDAQKRKEAYTSEYDQSLSKQRMEQEAKILELREKLLAEQQALALAELDLDKQGAQMKREHEASLAEERRLSEEELAVGKEELDYRTKELAKEKQLNMRLKSRNQNLEDELRIRRSTERQDDSAGSDRAVVGSQVLAMKEVGTQDGVVSTLKLELR